MAQSKKALAVALGTAFAASVAGTTIAAENPFSMQSLKAGYQVAEAQKTKDGKCGEGKCSASKKAGDKAKEGKCAGDKAKEGKCAGDKAKEGKCAGEKK